MRGVRRVESAASHKTACTWLGKATTLDAPGTLAPDFRAPYATSTARKEGPHGTKKVTPRRKKNYVEKDGIGWAIWPE